MLGCMTEKTREISLTNLDAFARGCAILGTGGGGAVDPGLLAARAAIEVEGPVPVVELDQLDDDMIVLPIGSIGAPTVSNEMLGSIDMVWRLRDEVERTVGRPVGALMSSEIGGSNGVHPVAWAARLGLPVVDADAMGRAFPEVQMVSMHVAGLPPTFVAIADVVGNVSVLRPVDGRWAERLARSVAVAAGASALMSDYVLSAAEFRGAVIEGTVSQAVAIGAATVGASDPLGALVDVLGAQRVLTGKIVDIERRTAGGFVRGSVVLEGTGVDRGRLVRVEIQNENLVVFEGGDVRATVPDLISLVDTATATAISTESLRYGQRATVLAWPCAPLWRTARGLEVAGPPAFGYDLPYVPVEQIGATVA